MLAIGSTEILDRNNNLWSERQGVASVRPNPDTPDQATKHGLNQSARVSKRILTEQPASRNRRSGPA
jgi:hypothetical protein